MEVKIIPIDDYAWSSPEVSFECLAASRIILVRVDSIPACPHCKTACGVTWNDILGLFQHVPMTKATWPDGREVVIKGCGVFFTGDGEAITDKQRRNLMWSRGERFIVAWCQVWKYTYAVRK